MQWFLEHPFLTSAIVVFALIILHDVVVHLTKGKK